MRFRLFIVFAFLCLQVIAQLPDQFVYVNDYIPFIKVELRYTTSHNFVGQPIDGYHSNKLILTKPTALALTRVQEELNSLGYCLKVYDGYRPQRAVDHFMRWARDLNDTIKKQDFYPDVKKQHLFKEEYIATRSGHSRGSTVDLTLVDKLTDEELDMGSTYDFFGVESWVDHADLSEAQKANRQLLQSVMKKHGFKNYPKEWWHFTLRNEPFPDTYFDFIIDK
jgi:D-alanyl-D-alanine dipeptidase